MQMYLTHDEKVMVRLMMARDLQKAIDIANDKGNFNPIKDVLKEIHLTPRFKVDVNTKEVVSICGTRYGNGDKTVLIKEDDKRMFVVYKSKEDGRVWLDFSQYDVMTEAEEDAMYESEREGERAMNNWANGFY